MVRPLEVEYPGAFYHVFNRDNAGENVFKGRSDKEKFLEYLGKVATKNANAGSGNMLKSDG